ncbi:MAG: helix-turn-helix domain-containing protein [Nanoarchaeota archaeon]|nr:helix-turn-helix domain-containing protein [Nanoarchaeota archaeon]MBU1945768.1 helix-turn-helix domain-containing protein [Nanoarchaeota archaeon]
MKQSLLEQVSIYLLKKGFTIKSLTRTAFDVLARKDETILLIKILHDANAVSEEYSGEMNRICSYICGSPLIISEKAGDKLQDNIVYSRFGIYTLNFNTFRNSIDNKFPFVKRDHSGIKAQVIGNKIKEIREREGISLSDIARKLGVSKRMVQKYEIGESEVGINKALRLYKIFGHSVFEKINIFSHSSELVHKGKSDISKKYSELGFNSLEAHKVPFDIISRKEKELILTRVGDGARSELDSLSKLVDADKLVIFDKKKPKDIPSLTKKEFMDFENARELIKFLKEFE